MTNKAVGNKGEDLAKKFLLSRGFSILMSNYRKGIGEIDIIARKDDTVHFVEVKYRRNDIFGSGRESVTTTKQRTIQKLATSFLIERKLYYEVDISFDVIEINGGIETTIEHLEACF